MITGCQSVFITWLNSSHMLDTVQHVRDLVAECIALRSYVNFVAFLFGWPEAKAEAQSQEVRLKQLARIRRSTEDAESWSTFSSENDVTLLLAALCEDKEASAQRRTWCKQNPIPILCDDEVLESLARRVKDGPAVVLSKDEIEKHFDFSRAFPFWDWIPVYTRIWFAFGLHWSYPDADLFQSMAFFHDETARAYQGVDSALSDMTSGKDRRADLFRGLPAKKMFACQTVVNACLLVEAFLNGIASVALKKTGARLSEEERSSLGEEKFVNTQDKLVKSVKLISPRNVGLDRDKQPYGAFREIQQSRDSIIHLKSSTVGVYESIGHETASRAADTAIAVIREVCRCLAVKSPEDATFPPWLKNRGSDGLFH